ncbi:MAG: stage V sporulation protein AC [Christensenellales bacterium]|jgi:stage V sporulation protein AC
MASKNQQDVYTEYVKEKMPKSQLFSGCLKAYLVGGIICVLGQAVLNFGKYVLLLSETLQPVFSAAVMVFLGATLTGIGVYDKIGKFAGAGSVVPITGFANSIVSPAMEFKREGYVLGVGAKMFIIAGPVLVYGIGASIIVGVINVIVRALS